MWILGAFCQDYVKESRSLTGNLDRSSREREQPLVVDVIALLGPCFLLVSQLLALVLDVVRELLHVLSVQGAHDGEHELPLSLLGSGPFVRQVLNHARHVGQEQPKAF